MAATIGKRDRRKPVAAFLERFGAYVHQPKTTFHNVARRIEEISGGSSPGNRL